MSLKKFKYYEKLKKDIAKRIEKNKFTDDSVSSLEDQEVDFRDTTKTIKLFTILEITRKMFAVNNKID